MPEDADISAINLREILSRVCKRARRLVDLELRCACLLAAQEPLPDVSDAERETLRAISGGQESLDSLRGDSRLAAIVRSFHGDAGEQVHKEESVRLKRSAFRQTALQVARDTFLNAAAQVVNGFTKPSSEENSDCWFAEFCCSVLDGKSARPQLLRAADILDTPDFRAELLGKLWKECPEEAKDLHLPNPAKHDYVFRKSGSIWQVGFDGESGQFRESKGFAILHKLLCSPNNSWNAIQLHGRDRTSSPAGYESTQTVIDSDTQRAIASRLKQLKQDRAQALKSGGDPLVLKDIDTETSQIEDTLAKATGLHGSSRRFGSGSAEETARTSVKKATGRAVATLRDAGLTRIADHFVANIHTEGVSFVYRPTSQKSWLLD